MVGPLPRSPKGHQYLLVVTDHFSKWVELFPLRKLTARAITEKLMEVFTRFGFAEALLTDRASYFVGKVFVDACKALGIKHRTTTPYHPQANITERCNRNIKPMLAAFAEKHRDWDAYIPEIGFALRSTVNRSTGFTPAFLTFGRELPNPMDRVLKASAGVSDAQSKQTEHARTLQTRMTEAFSEARRNLGVARAKQKAQYDRSRRDLRYKVGDLVLRRNHVLSDASKGFSASLAPKWLGPYRVHEVLSPLVYKLTEKDSRKVSGPVHVCDLKPYNEREEEGDEQTQPPRQYARKTRDNADDEQQASRYNLRTRKN